jgi:lipoprotein-anchoring transpeptidase ErfK/SrfK
MLSDAIQDTKMESRSHADGLRAELMTTPVQLLKSAEMSPAAAALPQIILSDKLPHGSGVPGSPSVVVVDKTAHRTHVLQMNGAKVAEVLDVPNATGREPGMTPEGRFYVLDKEKNPTWYPPPSIGGDPVGPGPGNPLGVAAIVTSADNGLILLHGTSRPDQIGTNASHGCIRHLNQDITRIYPLVQRGDIVYINKKFNGLAIKPEDFTEGLP